MFLKADEPYQLKPESSCLFLPDVMEISNKENLDADGKPVVAQMTMNVVMVGAECAPYSKTGMFVPVCDCTTVFFMCHGGFATDRCLTLTLSMSNEGGLADVMGALPIALANRGHRVMVVSPRYANYETVWDTTIRRTYHVFGANHEVRHISSKHRTPSSSLYPSFANQERLSVGI